MIFTAINLIRTELNSNGISTEAGNTGEIITDKDPLLQIFSEQK